MEPTDTAQAADGQADGPRIERVAVGTLAANCYLVTDTRTKATLIVDPGAEPERILAALDAKDLRAHVVGIVHTHGHFDHVGATEAILAALGQPIPLSASPADAYLYTTEARAVGATYGYTVPAAPAQPTIALTEGSLVPVGASSLRVLMTPGHTPGSLCLLAEGRWLISGDTLFRHGIGRTDLLGGDEDAIYTSIADQLYPLPGALAVYPGHGPATTIEEERRANPFIRGEGFA